MTRAWDSVNRTEDQIKQVVVEYGAVQQAICELGNDKDLKMYQEIRKSDLKMSGDIAEENKVGQRDSVLPWFWRLDRKQKEIVGNYGKECKCKNTFKYENHLLKENSL